jgi:hypothetical protein
MPNRKPSAPWVRIRPSVNHPQGHPHPHGWKSALTAHPISAAIVLPLLVSASVCIINDRLAERREERRHQEAMVDEQAKEQHEAMAQNFAETDKLHIEAAKRFALARDYLNEKWAAPSPQGGTSRDAELSRLREDAMHANYATGPAEAFTLGPEEARLPDRRDDVARVLLEYRQTENDYTNFVASYIDCASDGAALSKMSAMDRRLYVLKCEDSRGDVEASYTRARLAAVQAVKDHSPRTLSSPAAASSSSDERTAAR